MVQLDKGEIESILRKQDVGRIGMSYQDRVYVVPVSYAYEESCIYGFTTEGLKIQMMRQSPEVCFEVDHLGTAGSWESVIAWGRYEELHGADAEEAVALLIERLSPRLDPRALKAVARLDKLAPVAYRIRLREMTGRREYQQAG